MAGLLIHFYGGDGFAETGLPAELSKDIILQRELRSRGDVRYEGTLPIAWHKKNRGRQINLTLKEQPEGVFTLKVYEDQLAARRLQTLRVACDALKRDSASVFALVIALLDGIGRNDVDLLRAANLTALQPASARRLISKAKAVLNAN